MEGLKMVAARCFVLEAIGHEGLVEQRREIPHPVGKYVMVKTRFASLNFRDLKIIKGIYARNPALPVIPLSDGAGEVIEVGADVTRFQLGDRVMPIYMPGWYRGGVEAWNESWRELGGTADGMAREYGLHHEEDLVNLPNSLEFHEAATLPCAGVTAWHALVYIGKIKAGQTVLVLGSGGVSVFALQIARMSGAKVIATSSDDAKLLQLLRLGASEGINYLTHKDWEKRVRDLTGGVGVDHVVEVSGADTFPRSIAATRDGGHVHVVGNLTGDFPQIQDMRERGVNVTRIGVGSREMTEDLVRALDTNLVKPVIDRCFEFCELKEALSYLESGKHLGKIVLRF